MNRTLIDPGVLTAPDSLRFERVLPGPIENVWSYIVEPEKRGKWLASGPMELRVGGRAQLFFHHASLSREKVPTPERYKSMENGHTMDCKITEVEPPRLLSMIWGQNEPTEVTFELTPRGKDVLLVITHRKLTNKDTLLSVSGGWHTHLTILADVLNGREPQPFWTTHEWANAEYKKRLGHG